MKKLLLFFLASILASNIYAVDKVQKTDTAANWTSGDPTLQAGEIGYESDTGKWKFGDGSTAWTSLSYEPKIGSFGHVSCAADANVSAVVGASYFCDISGYSADRNFTLPTCSAGDQIRVAITTGDDTYEQIWIGDTGVSINGGSTATEWSRGFIDGESVLFECTGPDNWQVINDGRIPSIGIAERQAAQNISNASTTKIALDASVKDVGDIVDVTTNDRIDIRRSGTYQVIADYCSQGMDTSDVIQVSFYDTGSVARNWRGSTGTQTNGDSTLNGAALWDFSATDYVELYGLHIEGAAQDTCTAGERAPRISVIEQLP